VTQNSTRKLAIVVHTEEEFNWDGGFYRSNDKVTHGQELIEFCEDMINVGGKVTLAMDYAFVSSIQGQQVIAHFKHQQNTAIEFATHLHPWVNPPFNDDKDIIREYDSYPGNLPKEEECRKLKTLTDIIEAKVGYKPTTYLAGRYGVGKNTYQTLSELGYTTDLSISPFANFTHQKGPDFSQYDNQVIHKNKIKCIPHTTGYISHIGAFANYLNKDTNTLPKLNNSFIGKVLLRFLGVKRVRLSPEGFTLKEMKKLTVSLINIGVSEFIFSFHSPSVKVGLTPYTQTNTHVNELKRHTKQYINWFNNQIK
jgi:hypothetical protein